MTHSVKNQLMAILAGSLCLVPKLWADPARVIRLGADHAGLAISHSPQINWQNGDRICVVQLRKTLACGRVVKATSKGAIVKLDAPNMDMIAGDEVVPESQALAPQDSGGPKSRSLAAAETRGRVQPRHNRGDGRPALLEPSILEEQPGGDEEVEAPRSKSDSINHRFQISVGIHATTLMYYPMLSFQVAISPYFALSATGFGIFSSGNPAVELFGAGGLLGVNYYSKGGFRGIWLHGSGGIGYFSQNSGGTAEAGSIAVASGTVGYRGDWDLGMNMGIAVGAQFVQDPGFTATALSWAGVMPVLVFDLGISF